MEETELLMIKKKSARGVMALTSRTFLLQIVAFGATFLLTIFLSPEIFGIFYVVSAIIAFLGYFSDIGLAAALIQKKEDITKEDLETTFTIQQILVGFMVVITLVFSGPIATFYRLDEHGLFLFRMLVFAFFLSSLKTIPSVLLERKLEFGKLVIPQLLETLGFYLIAVVLAWKGYGIASFSWAVLVRSIVGLVSIYILSPWKMTLGFSKPVAKRLMRFGLPFQLNSLLALIKDDLLTVYLGKVLPFSAVGYIGWAKKWAEVPLRLIMDSIVRVTFPAFSRIQHDKIALGKALDKTLFGLSSTIFPISVGLICFIRPVVEIVPRYEKWEPALFSFYLFAISAAVASLSSPLTNALNAVGRIKTTLYLMMMWTTVTWILTAVFLNMFGFNGFSMALFVISATIIIVVILVKKIASISFIHNTRSAFLSATIQFIWYMVLLSRDFTGIPILGFIGFSGVILYAVTMWFLERDRLTSLISYFYSGRHEQH